MQFLDYLKNWKESCDNRQGNFDQSARSKMFISWQTHEGFKVTVHSVIEATKLLLQEGVEFVLTERFCQDSVEEYRKRTCISRTFLHKIEAKNRGCGLSMDTSMFGVLKNLLDIHKTS